MRADAYLTNRGIPQEAIGKTRETALLADQLFVAAQW